MTTTNPWKHIATAARYGITGKRGGTCYLYSEQEISDYAAELHTGCLVGLCRFI